MYVPVLNILNSYFVFVISNDKDRRVGLSDKRDIKNYQPSEISKVLMTDDEAMRLLLREAITQ